MKSTMEHVVAAEGGRQHQIKNGGIKIGIDGMDEEVMHSRLLFQRHWSPGSKKTNVELGLDTLEWYELSDHHNLTGVCIDHKAIRDAKNTLDKIPVHPSVVAVFGDLTESSIAVCAASVMGMTTAHIEGGQRNKAFTEEEFNRNIIDGMSDRITTHYHAYTQNLLSKNTRRPNVEIFEGINPITAMASFYHEQRDEGLLNRYIEPGDDFVVASIGRVEHLRDTVAMNHIIAALSTISREQKVILLNHKPTEQAIDTFVDESNIGPGIIRIDEASFLEFQALLTHASAYIGDGSSTADEAAHFSVPVLATLDETHRTQAEDLGFLHLAGKTQRGIEEMFFDTIRPRLTGGGNMPGFSADVAEQGLVDLASFVVHGHQ